MNYQSETLSSFSGEGPHDITELKGRCDLMPLETIAEFSRYLSSVTEPPKESFSGEVLFKYLNDFTGSGNKIFIHYILELFIGTFYGGNVGTALLGLAVHFEQDAQLYSERSWEAGIYCHHYINGALRHGLKLLRGDQDSVQARAFMWNLFCLLWTIDNRPQFNDLKYAQADVTNSLVSADTTQEVEE